MPRSLLSKAELQSKRHIVMRCYTKKTRSLAEINRKCLLMKMFASLLQQLYLGTLIESSSFLKPKF